MELYEFILIMIGFIVGALIIRRCTAWLIAKTPCYVCSRAVGKTNRVNTNGEWYHFDCWVKVAREKIGLV